MCKRDNNMSVCLKMPIPLSHQYDLSKHGRGYDLQHFAADFMLPTVSREMFRAFRSIGSTDSFPSIPTDGVRNVIFVGLCSY